MADATPSSLTVALDHARHADWSQEMMKITTLTLLAVALHFAPATAATSVSYTYDSQGRLTSVTYVGTVTHTVTYTYDAAGNRTSVVTQ